MNARKLFSVLFAVFLSSAAFADEIGSGEIDPPPGTTGTTTGPAMPIDEADVTSDTTTADESLWMQLLDWID